MQPPGICWRNQRESFLLGGILVIKDELLWILIDISSSDRRILKDYLR